MAAVAASDDDPDGGPDAAGETERIEDGRPAGAVAENARRQHADDGAERRAGHGEADDARALGRRSDGRHERDHRRTLDAVDDPGQQAHGDHRSDVQVRGGRYQHRQHRLDRHRPGQQPPATDTIRQPTTRHLAHTHPNLGIYCTNPLAKRRRKLQVSYIL